MRFPMHLAPVHLAVAALAMAQGAAAPASEGGGAGLHLIAMDMLDVPIVEGDRSDGRLRLKLVLRIADAAGAERIKALIPELREASLAAALEFGRLYASPFAPVDARRLAADMTAALRARDAGIQAVLLVEVSAVRT